MPDFTSTSTTSASVSDAIPTYAGWPALKPSIYGWLVALYMFIAGMAGSVQIIATMFDLAGPANAESLVLAGRIVALLGATAGGILLIVELHTPKRFYNMLRIFRPTSPMSIGSFVLCGFGFFSLVALGAQVMEWRWLTLCAGLPAALLGLMMTSYPAALLAATSTPLWSAAPCLLAMRFASASLATGAAAMCVLALWLARPEARVLALVAVVALVLQAAVSAAERWIYARRRVDGPLRGRLGLLHLAAGQIIGGLIPVGLYLWAIGTGASLPMLAASFFVLAGNLLMRGAFLLAGNDSACRPEDYFRLARIDEPARDLDRIAR